jgi:hypothetical protein
VLQSETNPEWWGAPLVQVEETPERKLVTIDDDDDDTIGSACEVCSGHRLFFAWSCDLTNATLNLSHAN